METLGSTRVIAMLDVVESVRLIAADEAGTIARWQSYVARFVESVLPPRDGRMIKSLGDGLMVEFQGATDAIAATLEMIRLVHDGEARYAESDRVFLRAAIHLGTVIEGKHDIYGDAINLASRLLGIAEPGDVVVSLVVRDQLAEGLAAQAEDLGERLLRNIDHPVRAFRLRVGRALGDALPRPASRASGKPSIAVLPLRNLIGDPAMNFLGDAMVEDVTAALSRSPELLVISRLSTLQFRDRAFQPRDIGAALRVGYVLSGSIRASGPRLRLTVELTEVESGEALWVDRFEGTQAMVFELQDTVADAVLRHVAPYVRERELRHAMARRPENLEAFQLMLRGLELMHRFSRADFEAAYGFFDAATLRDATFAAPFAWMATWYIFRVGQGFSKDPNVDSHDAMRVVDLALARDRTEPLALSVHGHVAAYLFKDFDTAQVRFERALAVNPNSSLAWMWSAATHAYVGNGREAIERAHHAIRLTPYDPFLYCYDGVAALAHLAGEEWDEAIAYGRKSLRLNRQFTAVHRVLAIALVSAGEVEEARRVIAQMLEIEPTMSVERFRLRFPSSNQARLERYCQALADAGLRS